MIYGLKKMVDNEILHNDIKPENIVYNLNNNRMTLIDVGLMATFDDSKMGNIPGIYNFIRYVYYPPES